MSKKFHSKLHYLVKYAFIALPLLVLLIYCLGASYSLKEWSSTTDISTTTTTTTTSTSGSYYKKCFYFYVDDFNDEEINFSLRDPDVDEFDLLLLVFNDDSEDNFEIYNPDIFIVSEEGNVLIYDEESIEYECGYYDNCKCWFFSFIGPIDWLSSYDDYLNLVGYNTSYIDYFYSIPQSLIGVSTPVVSTNTTISTSNSSLAKDRIYLLIKDSFDSFKALSINQWYVDLINTIGLTSTNFVVSYICYYPLWLMWVYIFDLICDIFSFIPKLLHKISEKFGGDY